MRSAKHLLLGSLGIGLAVSGLGAVAAPPARAAAPVDIQIIGTNDFHGRILNEPTSAAAGAAILSAAVKDLRAANPNTVFAAAGDLIGASTFESFVSNDKPTIDALNEAGLEVSAVGNHELDQGYDDLMDRVMAAYDPATNPEGGAEWEYIAANLKVRATGDPAVPASWIKPMAGIDVGFVGAVTEALPTLVSPDGIADIEVQSIVDSVNAEATRLVEDANVDLVVMLVHEGAPSTDCATMDDSGPWAEIINNVSADVDAIVSGHTHLAYNCSFPVQDWVDASRPVTERPVVSAGQYGQKLNKLVFSVDPDTGGVQAKSQEIIDLKTCSNSTTCTPYTPDPAVTPIVQAAVDVATPIGEQVLGPIAGPFNRAKLANGSENRGGESTLGNLVAEVQRAETPAEQGGAQIAFMNPGGLRAEMEGTAAGAVRNLTYRQAANVQPFANGLVNMDLTGAQIEKILEQQWSRTPDGTQIPSGLTRYFLRLGVSKGFTYTYREVPAPAVPVQGGGTPVDTWVGDVTGMWLNGQPIVPTQTYSVTANAFLAGGGDSFWEFRNAQGKAEWGVSDLQAMTHYMDTNTDAGGPALPVDYSQRAVEVHNLDASYRAGGRVRFDVESWSMSNPSDLRDTEIEVRLGGRVLGRATLDNTVGAAAIDKTGTARIDVALPSSTPAGPQTLTLVGAQTGTQARVAVTVAKGTVALSAKVKPGKKIKLGKTRAKVKVAVVGADGIPATGQVKVKVKGQKARTVTVVNGKAKVKLKAFTSSGIKKIKVTYLGSTSQEPAKVVKKIMVVRR
ncbi:bifunctional UDP-sugar hydrolase/5'-nucleotidase [Nocardioides sp. LHD-245]|uniref:bifunctional metallophosphatase/5'-nucleotidase n=1 Tax=Nocardioides sp. LHD-245 TaxID=3051387 RepID=UPI0027DFA29D|nr:bifunctional UDP-sugar hydrolase/5'-nucleotidase [Nocardioides sp. LHD-245]